VIIVLGPPLRLRLAALRSAARCSLGPAQKTSFCLVCGFAALPTIARPLSCLFSLGLLLWRLGSFGPMGFSPWLWAYAKSGGKPLFAINDMSRWF